MRSRKPGQPGQPGSYEEALTGSNNVNQLEANEKYFPRAERSAGESFDIELFFDFSQGN